MASDIQATQGRPPHEPRAKNVQYHRTGGIIAVSLTNGCDFLMPVEVIQGLKDATPEQIAEVKVDGGGYGLHWEALDLDLSVPGLLNGLFGTASYMAKRAEETKSPAKSEAAGRDGAKARRPRMEK